MMISHFEVTEPSYLSSPPYFPVIHRYEPEYKLQVFADVVVINRLNYPPPQNLGSGKQKLRTFSDKSRKSMIMFLAKVEETPDFFVTLTYSDDVVEYAYCNMHAHLESFRKYLERAYPGIRAMWRIEFQSRKSGKFKGEIKPHFHLLVWLSENIPVGIKELILKDDGAIWRARWHSIIKSNNAEHLRYYGCQVLPIRNRRHAYSYCSKYLAKADFEPVDAGRRWGRIGTFEHHILLDTELTAQAYIELKRLMNKYVKIHHPKFYKQFKRMPLQTGCSVFGLGYLQVNGSIDQLTIVKMLRHARDIALEKPTRKK